MAKFPAPPRQQPARRLSGLDSRPIVAGTVTALVGFTSSFAVVLAGLRAVGADAGQAASGLLAVTLAVGLGVLADLRSWRRIARLGRNCGLPACGDGQNQNKKVA